MSLASRLKPRHLRLVLKIAESGKLQAAADLLALSQPAASRLLSQIEDEAGGPLFQRHPKGMDTTALGDAFVKHARMILSGFESLEAEVANLSTGQTGEIRVGSVTGPTAGSLIPAIERIKEASPGLRATIEVGPSTQLFRGLEEGRFDFILSRIPQGYDPRDYEVQPARTEIVSLVVRSSHPYAGRPLVRLSEIAAQDWVIQEPGSPIRQAVEETFHAHGVPTPAKVTNSSSLLVALALLERTDVIAPQTMEVADILSGPGIGARLVTLRLAERIMVSPYFIIQNRSRQVSPLVDRVLREVLRRL